MTSKHILPAGIVVLFCIAAVIAAPAQSTFFTTLASFNGTDGAQASALVQATDGNFYGTAPYGGAPGAGVVFKITPSGTLTTLYSFCSDVNCADGEQPFAPLMQGNDGNFYGTTLAGGVNGGGGTVFKITPTGTLTTLYSFCMQMPSCTDGAAPWGALVQASDGDFYGTTGFGGLSNNCWSGCGTVFKITPSGTLTTLHSFCVSGPPCLDGYEPEATLVEGSDGNFYGTTAFGTGGVNNFGTIFKITPTGTLTTVYTFDGYQGVYPTGALVQARDGNFYGATLGGGILGDGTVFKITPAGSLTTVHSFEGWDGIYPSGALVQAGDGNFYGTTRGRGGLGCTNSGYGCGTVFGMTPSGGLTTLHSFNLTDGSSPSELVQARDGSFYGTTGYGGAYGYGTVFRVGVARNCATCRP